MKRVLSLAVLALLSTTAFGQDLDVRDVWTAATGVFDDSAAEIVAHDPASGKLFVINGAASVVDIIDDATGDFIGFLDVSAFGGPTSCDVSNGIVCVAVAAPVETDPGFAVLFDSASEMQLNVLTTGALPDSVSKTPDGTKFLLPGEGEPDAVDPLGTVNIVDISGGALAATVTTIDFSSFAGQEDRLRTRNIRIFPGASADADVEPEFIAANADGTIAFVALQEANALGVVDLVAGVALDILPIGLDDHSRGEAAVTNYEFPALPFLGTTATVNPADPTETTTGQDLFLGGFSGLWLEDVDPVTGVHSFLTVPDRGPNAATADIGGLAGVERPFPLPDYQARVTKFDWDPATGDINFSGETLLFRQDGITPITGRSNIPTVDENPVDLWGNALTFDEYGADLEGILIAPDGTYWMCDEYRPAIYHFQPTGTLIERYVPAGTAALNGDPVGTYGAETLPAVYSQRRRNRGFEAIALDPATNVVYAFIQTPIQNPDRPASDFSASIRILGIDATTGTAVEEYIYFLEDPSYRVSNVDKIGDAVYTGNGKFLVLERDSAVIATAKKFLYEINITNATNLVTTSITLPAGKTLEQSSVDELVAGGLNPVRKVKLANLPSLGYLAGDKPEGVVELPDGRVAVLNDNDFGLLDAPTPFDGTVPVSPDPTPVVLGIIDFDRGNGIDPSDDDGVIDIRNVPVYGMAQPDGLTSFVVVGATYFVGANEGDDRGEDERIEDLLLDPTVFPDAATLQLVENLGRLGVSTIDGDVDGDGDQDELWAYGSRSVTIFDEFGNRVWDSGDLLEQVTAAAFPADFNANNDENQSFESRSDNKGPEPEAVEVGQVGDDLLLFVGLERIGGIVVLNINDPSAPLFVTYFNNRNFAETDATSPAALDLGPEGLEFIAAEDSPFGVPSLVVANEVSGTTTFFALDGFAEFIRGDATQNGSVNFFDGLAIVGALIFGQELDCEDAYDTNDDGTISFADAIAAIRGKINFFTPIPAPRGACGNDLTVDSLDCQSFDACP